MILPMREGNSTSGQIRETNSAEETFQFGFDLARSLPGPRNILLYGDLGMGKTVLAKGIICGLGVTDPDDVVSPSFTLIQEYRPGGRIIQHVDLYRLERVEDIDGLGLDEVLLDEAMYVIIEWADKLPTKKISNGLAIYIRDLEGNSRSIQVEAI